LRKDRVRNEIPAKTECVSTFSFEKFNTNGGVEGIKSNLGTV
jgi:hypothetical protein